jgi:heme-degrading monooxygenase HmoA
VTFVRVATYPFDPTSLPELSARAQEELVPIYRDQPGFRSLSVVAAGDEIVSISHWDSAEQARQGAEAAMAWAKEQQGLTGPATSNRIGEEIVSST